MHIFLQRSIEWLPVLRLLLSDTLVMLILAVYQHHRPPPHGKGGDLSVSGQRSSLHNQSSLQRHTRPHPACWCDDDAGIAV